jgi:hypothetical protein
MMMMMMENAQLFEVLAPAAVCPDEPIELL